MKLHLKLLAAAACLSLLAACAKPPMATPAYFGPTLSLQELAEDVNHNTDRIPTLWAKGDYDASIVDHGHRTNVSGDALVMYGKPHNLLFVGWAGPLGQVFRMGSGPDQYWLTVKGDADTTWYGSFAHIEQADLRQIPVRPDLVEAVLGLDSFDTNLSQQPCPVLRFNNDQRAYMVVWNLKYPGRWIAQKEIWYDLDTKLPRLVNLFDVNGRVVLSAYLTNPKPVTSPADGAGNATPARQPSERPMVMTQYHLFFPDTGSTLRLHFSQMRFKSQNHPDARNFMFDPQKVDTKHVFDLD